MGITISIKEDGDLAFFSNGLRQNVVFLYHLFKASPNCERVYLVSQNPPSPKIGKRDFGVDWKNDLFPIAEVAEELDYLISLGSALEISTFKALRERGVKVINYKGGNGAVISMEASVADPPRKDAESYSDYDCYDAIWMTPQHMHTYAGWCRTIYRCPVYEVPQVWNPLFSSVLEYRETIKYGYSPPSKDWRIAVMDPNITVMKTSHMPMLVTEAAYRKKPSAINHMFVAGARRFADHQHFKRFCNLMRLHQEGKLSVEDRFIGWIFIAQHADAVVTHHWENGLNYLYYEVLYGGYPLIHNSEFLRDYGYYYPAFDVDAGADALIRAHETHDANLEAYKARNNILFEKLEPTSTSNIEIHEKLMFE